MNSQLISLIKNIITIAAGLLVGKSIWGVPITTETGDLIIGVVVAVATLIWSIKDKTVTIEQWQGAARRIISFVGGILIAKGITTPESIELWFGLANALIALLQGVLTRQKAAQLATGEISVMQLKGATDKRA
jgi:hypothetical protein